MLPHILRSCLFHDCNVVKRSDSNPVFLHTDIQKRKLKSVRLSLLFYHRQAFSLPFPLCKPLGCVSIIMHYREYGETVKRKKVGSRNRIVSYALSMYSHTWCHTSELKQSLLHVQQLGWGAHRNTILTWLRYNYYCSWKTIPRNNCSYFST